MSEFIRDKAGATEAQQKKALAFLFTQTSAGLAATGVLTGLAVAQTGTASASVLVAAGAGVSQDTVGNGASELVNDTQKTLDILTANPMGATPRNDIVVFDSATTSIRVIVGTPNAVPTDPTVPATAIPLARLRHAASATTVPTAKIDDLRFFTSLFGVATATGSRTGLATLAAGAFATWTETFPTGRFATAPKVCVIASSGRLNMAAKNVTTTGFTVEAFNCSAAGTGVGTESYQWIAQG